MLESRSDETAELDRAGIIMCLLSLRMERHSREPLSVTLSPFFSFPLLIAREKSAIFRSPLREYMKCLLRTFSRFYTTLSAHSNREYYKIRQRSRSQKIHKRPQTRKSRAIFEWMRNFTWSRIVDGKMAHRQGGESSMSLEAIEVNPLLPCPSLLVRMFSRQSLAMRAGKLLAVFSPDPVVLNFEILRASYEDATAGIIFSKETNSSPWSRSMFTSPRSIAGLSVSEIEHFVF